MTRQYGTMIVALLLSAAVLAGIFAMVSGGETGKHAPGREETTMTGGRTAETVRGPKAVPPMDLAQPAVTETATFALG